MKVEPIDILKLYSLGSHNGWNQFLTKCHQKHDIQALAHVRTGLQVGMRNLERNKLNDDKIDIFFVRLTRSIENTLKKILKEKYPNPCDNALTAKEFGQKALDAKRARDREFEAFLRKTSY